MQKRNADYLAWKQIRLEQSNLDLRRARFNYGWKHRVKGLTRQVRDHSYNAGWDIADAGIKAGELKEKCAQTPIEHM